MATFMKGMQLIPSGVSHLKMIGFVTNQIMEPMFWLQEVLESSFQLSSLCNSVTSKFFTIEVKLLSRPTVVQQSQALLFTLGRV